MVLNKSLYIMSWSNDQEMPIYGFENFENLLLRNQTADDIET